MKLIAPKPVESAACPNRRLRIFSLNPLIKVFFFNHVYLSKVCLCEEGQAKYFLKSEAVTSNHLVQFEVVFCLLYY